MADALARQNRSLESGQTPDSEYRRATQSFIRYLHSGNQLDLHQARNQAIAAHQLQTGHLPSITLLAQIYLKLGQHEQATAWVQTGLTLRPDSPRLLFTAGKIAFEKGALPEAEQWFTKSSAISLTATDAQQYLADIWMLQGRYTDAFLVYRERIKTRRESGLLRSRLFQAAEQIKADVYNPDLAIELTDYLTFSDCDPNQLSHLTTSMLEAWFREGKNLQSELQLMISQPLLRQCMKVMPVCSQDLEIRLTRVRGQLLLECAKTLMLPTDYQPLLIAMAWQCWQTEGSWAISEAEYRLLGQLQTLADRLMRLPEPCEQDVSALAKVCTLLFSYWPIAKTPLYQQLNNWVNENKDALIEPAWPQALDQLIQAYFHEQQLLQQRRLSQSHPGDISDATSLRVKSQYDLHPYPRWTALGNYQTASYEAAVKSRFPDQLADWNPPSDQINMLVAGCGTGRHAIQLARYFQPLRVTAIDLGETSLAYASLKAHEYRVWVNWHQLDILQVDRLNQTFDVIECSGVLHHMASPLQGLKALTSVLNPGGVIKIALYSHKARVLISHLREMLDGIEITDDTLRLLRHSIISGEINTLVSGDWSKVMESADFYSLSACRDLLAHEQELQFDIATIEEDLLKPCGLSWVGMLPPDSAGRNTRTAAVTNTPEYWAEQEEQNPALFSGMYQFYARRSD